MKDIVLIVEDDRDYQDIFQSHLEKAGYKCVVAPNYSTASFLLTSEPLVLILDLNLEGEGDLSQDSWQGWLLAQEAQQLGISSVIVTGYGTDDRISRRAYREFAIIDFFDKGEFHDKIPAFLESVKEAVKVTLHRRTIALAEKPVVQTIDIQFMDGRFRLSTESEFMGQTRTEFASPIPPQRLVELLDLIGSGRLRQTVLQDSEAELLRSSGFEISNLETNDILEQLGKKLFDALTAGKVGTAMEMERSFARRSSVGFHLRLRFDDNSAHLARYPWELIHDGRRFLSQGRIGFSRGIGYADTIPDLNLTSPLRVLFVEPRPIDLVPKLPLVESRHIITKLEEIGIRKEFEITCLKPPVTYDKLVQRLEAAKQKGRPFHILYFDGHGDFGWMCPTCETINGEHRKTCQGNDCQENRPQNARLDGFIYLENNARGKESIDSNRFAVALARSGLQVVMFSACNTGQVDSNGNIFNMMGSKIIEEGIPAVIAMQFPVSTADTRDFFAGLLSSIGLSPKNQRASIIIENAMRTARKYILSERWFYPVLYLRTVAED